MTNVVDIGKFRKEKTETEMTPLDRVLVDFANAFQDNIDVLYEEVYNQFSHMDDEEAAVETITEIIATVAACNAFFATRISKNKTSAILTVTHMAHLASTVIENDESLK